VVALIPLCSLTLDRPSLDKGSGFIRGKKAVEYQSVDGVECLLVFTAGTRFVATKGVFLGMQDIILYRDDRDKIVCVTLHSSAFLG
jgi:hypothetical protein